MDARYLARIYASVFRRGKISDGSEVRVSRIATICLGVLASCSASRLRR